MFRLASVSPDLVSAWLVRDFNHVSAVDRGRIAAFSDGNFRIARALAETLRRGESLGQLRNKDLFERIFQQRNAPDASLLRDAEILALLYSFDGDDVAPGGELARLAVLAGRPTQSLYGVLADLAERSVLQQRGRWRALLPQALANPLAASALKRIPDQAFDVFCASLPDRMLRSLTRRLGFLHDSSRAQTTVARWLAPTGLFDQLFLVSDFTLVQNLAPIAPEAMLAKIEVELKGVHRADILDPGNHQRDHWIGLLKSLAYDPDLFTRAGLALACFLAAEPEPGGHNSAKTTFEELFHLHLSGTQADPQARRDLVGALCRAQGPGFRRAGAIGLEALLASEHFSSSSDFDFGARPRDYGWEPKTYDVIWAWYDDAIDLLLGLSDRLAEAKSILARNVHSLWRYPACHDRLEAAAIRFETEGWTEGWMAFRAARRFDAADMPPEMVGRLDAIIARLTPTNLTARARAYILSHPQGAHNVADGEGGEDDVVGAWNLAADTAIEIGRAMAANAPVLMAFLPELIGQPQAERAYQFGQGLARGSEDPAALWSQLLSAFEAGPAETRSPTFLGGFVGELARQNPKWIEVVFGPDLEARIAPRYLPFLLAQAGWTEQSLDRVTALVAAGAVAPADLLFLGVREAPTEAMSRLLTVLAELPSGPAVAIRILSMILHCARTDELPLADVLVESGRLVLQRVDLGSPKAVHDHAFGHVAAACLPGPAGAPAAVIICARLRAVLDSRRVSRYELHGFLEALLKAQPAIALDALLLAGLPQRNHDVLERNYGRGSPLAVLSADSLCDWADNDPVDRYPRLGQILSLFTHKPSDDISGLSPLFVEVLARAPDPILFLGDVLERVHPRSGAGSAADMLEKRQKILATSGVPALETWISGGAVTIAQWIESYRAREIEREESFE